MSRHISLSVLQEQRHEVTRPLPERSLLDAVLPVVRVVEKLHQSVEDFQRTHFYIVDLSIELGVVTHGEESALVFLRVECTRDCDLENSEQQVRVFSGEDVCLKRADLLTCLDTLYYIALALDPQLDRVYALFKFTGEREGDARLLDLSALRPLYHDLIQGFDRDSPNARELGDGGVVVLLESASHGAGVRDDLQNLKYAYKLLGIGGGSGDILLEDGEVGVEVTDHLFDDDLVGFLVVHEKEELKQRCDGLLALGVQMATEDELGELLHHRLLEVIGDLGVGAVQLVLHEVIQRDAHKQPEVI